MKIKQIQDLFDLSNESQYFSHSAKSDEKLEMLTNRFSKLKDLLSDENEYAEDIKTFILSEMAKEKSERRIDSLIRSVEAVRNLLIEGKTLWQAIDDLNQQYSEMISCSMYRSTIVELESFIKILKGLPGGKVNVSTLIEANLVTYSQILEIFKISKGAKSVARLKNIRIISERYMDGGVHTEAYISEISEQVKFFESLLDILKSCSRHNLYIYLLRYDLRSSKMRKADFLNRIQRSIFEKLEELRREAYGSKEKLQAL